MELAVLGILILLALTATHMLRPVPAANCRNGCLTSASRHDIYVPPPPPPPYIYAYLKPKGFSKLKKSLIFAKSSVGVTTLRTLRTTGMPTSARGLPFGGYPAWALCATPDNAGDYGVFPIFPFGGHPTERALHATPLQCHYRNKLLFYIPPNTKIFVFLHINNSNQRSVRYESLSS